MPERKPKRTNSRKLPVFVHSTLFKVSLAVVLFAIIGSYAVVIHYHRYYSRIIERKLGGEIFKNTAQIYAAPFRIHKGQRLTSDDVITRLQRAGFESVDKGGSEDGSYELSSTGLTIRPKTGDTLRLVFQRTALSRIVP